MHEYNHIIDENADFQLNIKYFSNKEKLDINISSYSSSNNNFANNFIKLIHSEIKNNHIVIYLYNEKYLELKFENDNLIKIFSQRKITSFETRLIGRHAGDYIPIKISNQNNKLYTDLHTHLSGQIDADSLIDIGNKYNILYPISFFTKIGIELPIDKIKQIEKKIFLPTSHLKDNTSTHEQAILFNDLSAEQKELLKNALSLSPEDQSTFEDIEDCYYLREPFTKNIDLLEDILESVAKQYNKYGIKYVELSSNSIIDRKWLDYITKILPRIEHTYSINFRFLIGLPRNLSREDLRARLDLIKNIISNKYIIGIDLLGYEINTTIHIEDLLASFAKYTKHIKNFVFRIHAGENSKNPNNVKDALFFAMEHDVRLRIGHAIYGIDEETLILAKRLSDKNQLIVEFNPDSNLASNNIDFPEDMQIKRFINYGIKSVLSSDGAGLYKTNAKQISVVGEICCVLSEDFDFINKVENSYINDVLNNENITNTYTNNNNDYDLTNRTPILIAGASGSSWIDIDSQGQNKVKNLLKELLDNLDPDKVYFITGRSKDKGIAIELGKIIALYNFENKNKFLFISMISETDINDMIKYKGMTHIKQFPTPLIYLPSDKISHVKQHNGIAIFIGGKSFTRDFILEAHKQKIDFAIMQGIFGASNEKSKIYINNKFADFSELKHIIKNSNSKNILK